MAEKIAETLAVSKAYPNGGKTICVLDEVNLSLYTGDFAILLGPSGSGKSTLLHIMGLLDLPDSGALRLFGEEALALDERGKAGLRLQKLGFVFQFDSLLPEFTVLENADLPAMLAGTPDPDKAMSILRRFGMEELAHKMPSQLSGGEKQRVAIARALRNNPRLLLADEPTGNLDSRNTKIVLEDLARLAKEGITVLMATHDSRATAYATKVLTLEKGKISLNDSCLHIN